MICRIADLFVEVPEAGSMAPRGKEYRFSGTSSVDILVDESKYRYEKLPQNPDMVAYLDSGFQFYRQLLRFDGMMLHASAVAVGNRAYLFSGNCGVGKSTHTHLWQETFGDIAEVFNDDKPALRRLNGTWYAYGTPWCGKAGINRNRKVPLAGICFLKQSQKNVIRRMLPREAIQRVYSQTPHRFDSAEELDLLLQQIEKLVLEIPVFELQNKPEPEAVRLSYQTMYQAMQEE